VTKSNGAKTKPTARFLGGIDIASAAKNWKCILAHDRFTRYPLHHVTSNSGRLRTIFMVSRLTVMTRWNSSRG